MKLWGRSLAASALLLGLLWGGGPAAKAVGLQGITTSTHAGFSRVTIDLSGPAKPTVMHFAAEPEAGRPARIGLDFPDGVLDFPQPSPIAVRDGRIDTIRYGRTRAGGVRVVVDLVRPARYRGLRHTGPPRIELDVIGPAGDEPPAAAGDGR